MGPRLGLDSEGLRTPTGRTQVSLPPSDAENTGPDPPTVPRMPYMTPTDLFSFAYFVL